MCYPFFEGMESAGGRDENIINRMKNEIQNWRANQSNVTQNTIEQFLSLENLPEKLTQIICTYRIIMTGQAEIKQMKLNSRMERVRQGAAT